MSHLADEIYCQIEGLEEEVGRLEEEIIDLKSQNMELKEKNRELRKGIKYEDIFELIDKSVIIPHFIGIENVNIPELRKIIFINSLLGSMNFNLQIRHEDGFYYAETRKKQFNKHEQFRILKIAICPDCGNIEPATDEDGRCSACSYEYERRRFNENNQK